MAKRAGYTNDLEVAQFEVQQKFKNPREWQVTEPMMQKKEAIEWEKKFCEDNNLKSVKLESKKKQQRERWYGFVFTHDGPKK